MTHISAVSELARFIHGCFPDFSDPCLRIPASQKATVDRFRGLILGRGVEPIERIIKEQRDGNLSLADAGLVALLSGLKIVDADEVCPEKAVFLQALGLSPELFLRKPAGTALLVDPRIPVLATGGAWIFSGEFRQESETSPVVFKVLRGLSPDVQRIICEARHLGAFWKKGVTPRFFGVCELMGDFAIVEEKLDISLHHWSRFGKREERNRAIWIQNRSNLDLVGALIYQLFRRIMTVHESEIVHRDLKPANTLLGLEGSWSEDVSRDRRSGFEERLKRLTSFSLQDLSMRPPRVKLIDFESAMKKGETGSHQLTQIYAPPEAISRRIRFEEARRQKRTPPPFPETDVHADIYAMGCVLYELLSGDCYYPAGLNDLDPVVFFCEMQKRRDNPADLPSLTKTLLEKGVPRDIVRQYEPLETVIRKATAFEPEGRYQTMQEMFDDLFQAVPFLAERRTSLGTLFSYSCWS